MSKKRNLNATMRIIHRYLGFFLAGIMAVYSLSGIVLIFRDSGFLKQEKQVVKTVKPNASGEELGRMLEIRGFKPDREEGDVVYFKDGTYNKKTGEASYKTEALPDIIEKMTHLHKAGTRDPLFFMVGEKLVTAYRDQFRVARRSLLDLLNIQADVFNYRSAAQAAFHDERLARVRLLAATGDLARRFSAESGRVSPPAR